MRNFLILFPVFCLLVYASYELYLDYQRKPGLSDSSQQELLGTASQSINTVKRKSPSSPFWYNLGPNESVFHKDLIRTGMDSYTKIRLEDKSFIEIGQNTLISLEKNKDQSYSIDFKVGEFTTKNNQANLSVKVNDVMLEANKADFNIRSNKEDGAEVSIQKGSIQVRDKNNKVSTIDKKSQLNVDAKGKVRAMKTVVMLSSPEHLGRIKNPAREVSYPFTWAVLDDKIKQEIFQISSDENFDPKRTFQRRAHQSIEAPVKRGPNYWRVGWLTKDKNGKTKYRFTKSRKFFLDVDESVKLLNPKDESLFEFLPNKRSLIFEWDSKQKANLYLVEISKDPAFKNMMATYKTKEKSYIIKDIESGGYFWRVRALDAKNNNIGLSATNSFSVRNIMPKLPDLLEPTAGLKWTLDEPILFQWKNLKNAKEYFIEVARDQDFQRIVEQNKTNKSQWLWEWQNSGTYYWRVNARDNKNRLIGESIIEKFQIDPAIKKDSIQLIKPEKQELILREKTDMLSPVNFEWKSPFALSPKYRFILSKNPDLSEPIIKKMVLTNRNLETIEKSGTYFWKVEWLNEKEEIKYFSPIQAFQFQFSTSLPASDLELPVNKSIFYTSDKLDLDFAWSKVDKANKYLLQIEKFNPNTEQTRIIRSLTTNENETKVSEIPPGHYLWHIKALDEDSNEGTKSEIFRFLIKKKDALGAPKLRPAIVK